MSDKPKTTAETARRDFRHPGYTPGRADVPGLIELLASTDDDQAEALMRALLRAPEALGEAILPALETAVRPQRGRLTRLLGKLSITSQNTSFATRLTELAFDKDLKTISAAISALGTLPASVAAAPLLALAEKGVRPEQRRILMRALAQLGGEAGRRGLAMLGEAQGEAERQTLGRSTAILARDDARASGATRIKGEETHDGVAALFTRPGLAVLAVEEARAKGFDAGFDGSAHMASVAYVKMRGTLNALFELRIPESFALVAKDEAEARALLARFTEGPVRFRLDCPGLPRAALWDEGLALATRLGAINDPRESPWTIKPRKGEILLVPRGLDDPRFSYRVSAVPAASHPSLAAALVFLGGVRPDDVVWDPFVGSGLELVERAKLGPFAALHGSDLSDAALDAATANFAAAGVRVSLRPGDATSHELPDGVRPTLVVTNPPMGRRVARDGSIKDLLTAFVLHAGRRLEIGGRLVLASPLPAVTAAAASRARLTLLRSVPFDMGGFPADLQVFGKRPKA